MTSDELRAAAERLRTSQMCVKDCNHIWNAHRQCQWCKSMQRDVDVMYVSDFASDLLTREWLDAPTEAGWWWQQNELGGMDCRWIENLDTYTKAGWSKWKWCRAYVPELPGEKP